MVDAALFNRKDRLILMVFSGKYIDVTFLDSLVVLDRISKSLLPHYRDKHTVILEKELLLW